MIYEKKGKEITILACLIHVYLYVIKTIASFHCVVDKFQNLAHCSYLNT